MQRSVTRLRGIASVFTRGFRSTASVAMSIKVGSFEFSSLLLALIFLPSFQGQIQKFIAHESVYRDRGCTRKQVTPQLT